MGTKLSYKLYRVIPFGVVGVLMALHCGEPKCKISCSEIFSIGEALRSDMLVLSDILGLYLTGLDPNVSFVENDLLLLNAGDDSLALWKSETLCRCLGCLVGVFGLVGKVLN